MEILIAILATLGVVGMAGLIVFLARQWGRYKKALLAFSQTAEALDQSIRSLPQHITRSVEMLDKSSAALAAHGETVAALLAGLTNVSKEQVGQLVELQKLIQGMYRSDGTRGYQEYDAREADREYQIQEVMERGGVSREQAEDRLREQDMWNRFKVGRG